MTEPKITKTIDEDTEMLSWTDEFGNFNALIQPRMATPKEISDALSKTPGVVVGKLQGINFIREKKK